MDRSMGQPQKGFLYKGRYFLLPEDCESVADMLSKYGDGKGVLCREMMEDKCQAPYFINEHSRRQKLRLENSLVFPVDLWVMSHLEYNECIRDLSESFCKGCPKYTPTCFQPELSEEMSLNRVCFFREAFEQQANEPYRDYNQVDIWVAEFIRQMNKLGLEELLDAAKVDEASAAFEECLSTYVTYNVPPFLMGKKDDKYYFYCSTFFNNGDGLFMEYLCRTLSEAYPRRKSWEFRNFIPQGTYAPTARKPLGYTVSSEEYDHLLLNLTVCLEDDMNPSDAYLWFCGYVGEDRLRNATLTYMINYGALDGMLDAETIASAVEPCVRNIPAEEMKVPPVEWSPFIEEGKTEMTGVVQNRNIRWYHFMLDALAGETGMDSPWEEDDILSELSLPLAVFSLPIPGEGTATSPEFKKAGGAMAAFTDALGQSGLCRTVFQINSYHAMQIGFLVLNHGMFLQKVRYLSPIFSEYFPKLDVFTCSSLHGGHYAVSLDMPHLGTEVQR